MKKGFTLIELLAVIAVLAIVLLIAVPSIINVIKDIKMNALIKDEKMVANATKNYLSANQTLIPTRVGDMIEISLNTLLTNKYITDIKDPYTNTDCNGYVIVTKIDNGYSYNPHMKCGSSNTIGDSSADGLMLHYKFDDFQEPTVNLFNGDGSFDTSTGSHTGVITNSNSIGTNINGGWGCSTHFNDGVCQIEKNGIVTDNEIVWYHNAVTGWRAATGWVANLEANKTYTASVYTKTNRSDNGSHWIYAFYGPVGYQYQMVWDTPPTSKLNEWVRGTKTFTPDIAISGTAYLYGDNDDATPGLKIEYDGYQIEQKPYATPFTKGTRTGTVSDYANNNNTASLGLSTTPRWVEKARGGTGAYEFNGTSTYINAGDKPDYNISNTGTIMLWAKSDTAYPSTNATTSFKGLIAKTSGGGAGQQNYYIDWYGTDTTRMLRAGIGDATAADTLSVSNYDFTNWNHITLTWNGTNVILYSNGTEINRTAQTRNAQINTNNLEIGRAFLGDPYIWDGMIDEVQIYNRALSASEIYQIYNIEK